MDPVATTGLYTAMLRARESARPDALFCDPYAAALAGDPGADLLAWMEKQSPGASHNPVIAIRTKFFDDTLERIGAGGLAGPQHRGVQAGGGDGIHPCQSFLGCAGRLDPDQSPLLAGDEGGVDAGGRASPS